MTKVRLPWSILFIIVSVWGLLIEWPTLAWSSSASYATDLANRNEQAAFTTMQMDSEILDREKTVVDDLHRLPTLISQRGSELTAIDTLLGHYADKEVEKKLDGDGTVHIIWDGSQAASLRTLYDFSLLPLPISVNRLAVTATSQGVHVQVDGKAIGATQ